MSLVLGTLIYFEGENAFIKDTIGTLILIYCVYYYYSLSPYSFFNENFKLLSLLNRSIGPCLSNVYCTLDIMFACQFYTVIIKLKIT